MHQSVPAQVPLRADGPGLDRAFWVEIRRALLIALKAIEERHGLGSHRQT